MDNLFDKVKQLYEICKNEVILIDDEYIQNPDNLLGDMLTLPGITQYDDDPNTIRVGVFNYVQSGVNHEGIGEIKSRYEIRMIDDDLVSITGVPELEYLGERYFITRDDIEQSPVINVRGEDLYVKMNEKVPLYEDVNTTYEILDKVEQVYQLVRNINNCLHPDKKIDL